VIESPFATVRLRQRVTKGAGVAFVDGVQQAQKGRRPSTRAT
jgi:hypothetical protein